MSESPKPRVLFVCVENSCRSQMAEAFARLSFADRLEAASAGSQASGVINPKAIAAMAELGYDLTRHASKSLATLPDIEWDFVVTMGCGDSCPNLRARRRIDWQIPQPKDMAPAEFARVRDLVREHVAQLAQALANESAPRPQ